MCSVAKPIIKQIRDNREALDFFETVSFIIKSLCIGYDRTEGFITLLFCIFEIVYKLFNLALKALQNLNVFAKLAICLVKLCFKV